MPASKADRRSLLVTALFHQGKSAWPQLELSEEAFAQYLAERCGAELPGEARAADLYLACACTVGSPQALAAFDRAYLSRVERFLARLRPSPALVSEVRQAVRAKLFISKGERAGRIAEYNGDGALLSWVRVVAVRTAVDLERRRGVVADASQATDETALSADPELAHLKAKYTQAVNACFRQALANLPREQVSLLRRHHLEGRTLEQLAAEDQTHRATVARHLAAARAAALAEVRSLLQKEFGASPSEVKSLIQLMRSQLEVNLSDLQTQK